MTISTQDHTVSGEDRPRRRDDVAYVVVDGEAVLWSVDPEAMHVLNPTASLVWQLLDGDVDIAELAADIAESAGADPTEVRSDIDTLVSQLTEQRLLSFGEVVR